MIYFGFDEITRGWQRYFDLCNAYELRPPAPDGEWPSIRTLNRWRAESPRGFAFVLHADEEVSDGLLSAYEAGVSSVPDSVHEAWTRTLERARALAAKAILIETPPELMPSDTSRALMAQLGDELASQTKAVVIWEAGGLWTTEDGRAIAGAHGLVFAVDPFVLHAEDGDMGTGDACFRVTERAAARRQFDAYEMEELVGWTARHDRTFVLFGGRFKLEHAKELSLLLRES